MNLMPRSVLENVASRTLSWRYLVEPLAPMCDLKRESCVSVNYPLKAFNHKLKPGMIPSRSHKVNSKRAILHFHGTLTDASLYYILLRLPRLIQKSEERVDGLHA